MDTRRLCTGETVGWTSKPNGARAALAFLDEAEREVRGEVGMDVPLVDEDERRRLERAADGEAPPGWWGLLAGVGPTRAYVGVRVPDGPGADPDGDDDRPHVAEVAVHPPVDGALARTVEIAGELAGYRGAPCLDVWVRRADADRRRELVDVGCRVRRTLGVLRRPLADAGTAEPGDGVRVRSATPSDDRAIVEVLEAAHHGTPDGGWTPERLAARTSTAWFRYEDVWLAESDGAAVGLVWVKRRDDGVGEIHNLAVRPEAHGRGIGRALLGVGERHLRDAGFDDVVLWVDRANAPAIRLYERAGYGTAWDDLLVTTCGEPGGGDSGSG